MKDDSDRVLIVDDEEDVRWSLRRIVEMDGMEAAEATDGEAALDQIRLQSPDVVLLDMRMRGIDGYEVLQRAKALDGDLPVVMITGFGCVRDAVQTVKGGAYDYLVKPFENNEIVLTIRRALNERRLKRKLQCLTDGTEGQLSMLEMMGRSEKVRRLVSEVARVAPTRFSVLITGETGVGKEVVTRAIHQQSGRPPDKWVAVDCGAIPETLIESELFGHEKGAFTGADRVVAGKFESASGGTLFLDEISNLTLAMQGKLLRVLQEKQFYRVGGTRPIAANVRMLTATNQNLDQNVVTRTFRRDLFHRLSEYTIRVPPLRERKEDLIFLAKRFLHLTNEELGKRVRGFSESALDLMLAYNWPGNVRELRNLIRRGVLLAEETVEPKHLSPFTTLGCQADAMVGARASAQPVRIGKSSLREIVARNTSVVERNAVLQALEQTRGNKAAAARMLQIDYKTIHTKIKRYEIPTKGGENGKQAQ